MCFVDALELLYTTHTTLQQTSGECVACRALQLYSRPLSLTMKICIPTWASLAAWGWCKSKGDPLLKVHGIATAKACRLTQLASAACASVIAVLVQKYSAQVLTLQYVNAHILHSVQLQWW